VQGSGCSLGPIGEGMVEEGAGRGEFLEDDTSANKAFGGFGHHRHATAGGDHGEDGGKPVRFLNHVGGQAVGLFELGKLLAKCRSGPS
jgi:hypothetical protein